MRIFLLCGNERLFSEHNFWLTCDLLRKFEIQNSVHTLGREKSSEKTQPYLLVRWMLSIYFYLSRTFQKWCSWFSTTLAKHLSRQVKCTCKCCFQTELIELTHSLPIRWRRSNLILPYFYVLYEETMWLKAIVVNYFLPIYFSLLLTTVQVQSIPTFPD